MAPPSERTTHMRLVPGSDRPPWWTYCPAPAPSDSVWVPVGDAIRDTGRTVRLCVILLVLCVPTVLMLAIWKG
jgi:hypothetical protein